MFNVFATGCGWTRAGPVKLGRVVSTTSDVLTETSWLFFRFLLVVFLDGFSVSATARVTATMALLLHRLDSTSAGLTVDKDKEADEADEADETDKEGMGKAILLSLSVMTGPTGPFIVTDWTISV